MLWVLTIKCAVRRFAKSAALWVAWPFVIDTHDSLDTGGGYVASRYDAVFRNPQTNEVIKVLKFQDFYEKFGDYYVMTKQTVEDYQQQERIKTEFNFSNIKLLEAVAV
ncbi:hypothetical protein DSM107010_45840 [Chroococcidiopsis cubana SAG 39.79]|uniref:Uncharacterized protein n=1 Tax=Chroococcidiopsis cubana SAG 39.79 TaxID=388085 RepID=A0AB37UEW2_9CYAN|nr:DUF3386 family protein [Chroococcidiopsis cubana]RUT09288.1 hypothetical protein DSM107010_45840 [Chroococcidiopsis cubana SAG 39.79]